MNVRNSGSAKWFGLVASLTILSGNAAVAEPYGTDAILHLDRLPYLVSGISSGEQTSFDRSGGNSDNTNFLGTVNNENVMLDCMGPGTVYLLWQTGFQAADAIKVYIDNDVSPRLNTTITPLFSGSGSAFPSPLVGNDLVSSGGFYSYVPIPFSQYIRITTTAASLAYYHVGYQLLMPGTAVTSWTASQDLSAARALWLRPGYDPKPAVAGTTISDTVSLAAGQSQTIFETSGPREIRSLRIRIPDLGAIGDKSAHSPTATQTDILNSVNLRVYYDNETTPSVDAPLGAFYAIGRTLKYAARAFMVGADSLNYLYCFFPMPFATHCKIQLSSSRSAATPNIVAEVVHAPFTDPFNNVGYFKVRYGHEVHTAGDSADVLFLETDGSGKLVGIMESMQGNTNRAYMEGDERFYVDNNRTPVYHGTGTEDFYNGGWYFNHNEFTLPTHGYVAHITTNTTDYTACYRFLLQDAVTFRTHIHAGMEHGRVNEDEPEEAWTLAYYYHTPRVLAVAVDSVDVGTTASETAHAFTVDTLDWSGTRTASFEGLYAGTMIAENGKTNRGTSAFTVSIPPSNNGVVLRRMFCQVTYRLQEALVTINGAPAGTWYTTSLADNKWREDEFMVPASFTRGKSSLHVALKEEGNDWTAYKYWVFALTDTAGQLPLRIGGRSSEKLAPDLRQGRFSLSVFSPSGRLVGAIEVNENRVSAACRAQLAKRLSTGTYIFRLADDRRESIASGSILIR